MELNPRTKGEETDQGQQQAFQGARPSSANPKQDFKPIQRSLISFESGHYKTVVGSWKGDSVWAHFTKQDGGQVHVNKDKVEYIETWPV